MCFDVLLSLVGRMMQVDASLFAGDEKPLSPKVQDVFPQLCNLDVDPSHLASQCLAGVRTDLHHGAHGELNHVSLGVSEPPPRTRVSDVY
jgi:hypothetical protein